MFGLEAGGGRVWGYRDGGVVVVMVAYLARGGSMGYVRPLLETWHGGLAMLLAAK